MNAWTRLVGVFSVAVLTALVLKVLPPLVVLLLFVALVAVVNHALRRDVKSQKAELRVHQRPGELKHRVWDPIGLLGYPFALFTRGEDPAVGDLSWGTWRGAEVKRFAFSCVSPVGTRTKLSCAIVPIGRACPPLVVESELFGQQLLSAISIAAAGETPSASGQRFELHSGDQRYADALLASPLVRWLDELDAAWGFEVSGSLALAYGPPSAGPEEPLERAHAFAELAAGPVAGIDAVERSAAPDGASRTRRGRRRPRNGERRLAPSEAR